MAYLDFLLADPVYLALAMAALSLVVSLTTCLYIAATARGAGVMQPSRRRPAADPGNFDRGFVDGAVGREGEGAVLETRLHFSGDGGNDDQGQRFV